ncbi:hypothetical protein FB45DRAFT_905424 [Roridomyces roridus]|uniref:Uncharacterized protein n=1 Tax=Roridomyces roridus TaxID=1738132 RepID=A0AAD7C5F8_9AGAR|nr:hypothetical protein FB45DRAFT_905424 [Roridomyces roridus]
MDIVALRQRLKQNEYIQSEVLSQASNPRCRFHFAGPLSSKARTAATSRVEGMKHKLKGMGVGMMQTAFTAAFVDATGGRDGPCEDKIRGVLEQNVLAWDPLFEVLLLRMEREGVKIDIEPGGDFKSAFLRYAGTLWYDGKGPGKHYLSLAAILLPLVRTAVRAFHEYRGTYESVDKRSGNGASRPMSKELRVMTAVCNVDLKTRPAGYESSASSDDSDLDAHGTEDEDEEVKGGDKQPPIPASEAVPQPKLVIKIPGLNHLNFSNHHSSFAGKTLPGHTVPWMVRPVCFEAGHRVSSLKQEPQEPMMEEDTDSESESDDEDEMAVEAKEVIEEEEELIDEEEDDGLGVVEAENSNSSSESPVSRTSKHPRLEPVTHWSPVLRQQPPRQPLTPRNIYQQASSESNDSTPRWRKDISAWAKTVDGCQIPPVPVAVPSSAPTDLAPRVEITRNMASHVSRKRRRSSGNPQLSPCSSLPRSLARSLRF